MENLPRATKTSKNASKTEGITASSEKVHLDDANVQKMSKDAGTKEMYRGRNPKRKKKRTEDLLMHRLREIQNRAHLKMN